MQQKLEIPRDACVLVGDGRKALLIRNEGDALHPNLQLERLLEAPDNPPTHLQGTDRPPRAVISGRRSAIEQTDWHELAEAQFAKDTVVALEEVCSRRNVAAIVIVAPPRSLAYIRKALPEALHRLVIMEINKDLTKIPVYEIERHLTGN
ncbi:host attachment protein [Microvirga sp. M2]|uniref:host attachment protein n=1 Tax=Microvirga sp. M2 TaxID=3073270 RepID=UPI0039C16FED